VLRKYKVFFLILFSDQAFKFAAVLWSWPIILNKGIAFGLLSSGSWGVIFWAVVVAIILFGVLLVKGEHLAWWFILGGGASNLVDRLFRGGVVDYIALPVLPRFNLADVAIALGGVWLIFVQLPYGKAKSNISGRTNSGGGEANGDGG